jgi:hypothetical protein
MAAGGIIHCLLTLVSEYYVYEISNYCHRSIVSGNSAGVLTIPEVHKKE